MKIFLATRRITIREIADDVGMSFGSGQAIFTDFLVIKHSEVKIVQKMLNFEQKTTSYGYSSGDIDDF